MRTALLLLTWAATVGAAFLFGTGWRPAPEDPLDAASGLDRPAARAPASDAEPGPLLAAPPSSRLRPTARAPSDAPSGAADAPSVEAGEVEAFTLEGVTDPDEAMGRIMRQVAALLGKGKDGHLEILRFLNDEIVENKELERLFGSEAEAARFIYPWVEFMVHRKGEVVDLVETTYETMAENPAFFEGMDDDTLEIFTEGASFLLPGAVDADRLSTFRGYAHAILETPEAQQPEAVQRNRRRIEQILQVWAPRLDTEEALAQLKSGQLKGPEALEALRRIPPERLDEIDVVGLLTPAIQNGDYRALRMLEGLEIDPRDRDRLDRTLIEAAAGGKAHWWSLREYLRATGRGAWPAARPLIETGLARGEGAASVAAETLAHLDPRPPKDYIQWVLDTYDLNEQTATRLRALFAIK